jgi:hypothetical protein
MTSDERSNLVLTFARTLFINGQATDQTVYAAERLGRTLDLRAKVMPRWGELQLQSDDTRIVRANVSSIAPQRRESEPTNPRRRKRLHTCPPTPRRQPASERNAGRASNVHYVVDKRASGHGHPSNELRQANEPIGYVARV